MTTPIPRTLDQPTGMSRFGVGAVQRGLAKVRLRLLQSSRGYAIAASLTTSPGVERVASRYASRRSDDLARFETALWDGRVYAARLSDVAGTVHRWWMRMVASGSNATLKGEIDRGEAALERSIRNALRMPPRTSFESDHVTDELRRLLQDVVETRRALRELPIAATWESA